MRISDIIEHLESLAPLSLQESYDNAGLIVGDRDQTCKGVLVSLDATEAVIQDALQRGCNLVVAHHPIVFSGLKKINGKNYVERAVIAAIKNDVAIYAIHTNLDNVLPGVNDKIADKLGLVNRSILSPKSGLLKKLYTYVPVANVEQVRDALFDAGAGQIGNYIDCSFSSPGQGSFKGLEGANPIVGKSGERHYEQELKLELVFEAWKERHVLAALRKNHPYEEVAYEIITLDNSFQQVGSGLIGELPQSMSEMDLLNLLKERFGLKCLRHTALRGKPVQKIALCGGAGSFLTKAAIASGADVYISSDIKYHEFFDADGRLVLVDIGHWESEQFTIDLLEAQLKRKFPTFAVLKTGVNTNPVQYLI